jgi:hypothetical protein
MKVLEMLNFAQVSGLNSLNSVHIEALSALCLHTTTAGMTYM